MRRFHAAAGLSPGTLLPATLVTGFLLVAMAMFGLMVATTPTFAANGHIALATTQPVIGQEQTIEPAMTPGTTHQSQMSALGEPTDTGPVGTAATNEKAFAKKAMATNMVANMHAVCHSPSQGTWHGFTDTSPTIVDHHEMLAVAGDGIGPVPVGQTDEEGFTDTGPPLLARLLGTPVQFATEGLGGSYGYTASNFADDICFGAADRTTHTPATSCSHLSPTNVIAIVGHFELWAATPKPTAIVDTSRQTAHGLFSS
ncbi:MAG: hypothetical protein COV10_00110 [Candidatus Vogelbacteria bacterium CG10_big_fil_rev_8_21_14_0_10_51_16]|uniref:Uncharacterized protein n=1 Tax=Candidatus Vogelbacteria bacterium CG10_big_fil_rev_8_21_14_0_10_51_16 TaxID=1975045 RepID=A0A2H0RFM9_9BACT|nr:MAG: hypothetical protein COV10_00110 [Candidatus Vogelbacteria bacterium CG10_big_fil_rev_8_21_14_0_10_51_16]